LAGSAGQFDPSQISPYMNSYEDSAVQQALQDVARQGQIQGQTLAANAVGAGAFGGARQGIAASELGRNVLQQQAQTAAAMRNQGYQQAAHSKLQILHTNLRWVVNKLGLNLQDSLVNGATGSRA
jgi:hypothetical protein